MTKYSIAVFLLLSHLAAAQEPVCSAASRCGNIVFDGDSISVGVGTKGPRPEMLLSQALKRSVTVKNIAVGGRPVGTCLQLFQRDIAVNFNANASFNLIVFHAGDNDIARGSSARETYDSFTQYVRLAHGQGWKVVVSTEIPHLNFDHAKEAALEDYDRMLVGNEAGADAVVDLSRDPDLFDSARRHDSPLFSPDLVHPNDTGYQHLNGLLVQAIQKILPPP